MNEFFVKFYLEDFLKECKRRVSEKKFVFIPRLKNSESMRELGLTVFDVEDIILNLTNDDYYRGPSKDHLYPEDNIWEFITEYDGFNIYIKLKLNNKDQTVCISFHEAERGRDD